jgi:polyisoprenoid-binding protein YceI
MIKAGLVCIVSALCLRAAEMQVQFDPSASHIQYTVDSVLHTVKGTFQLKSGTVRFDPAGGKASGILIADATSGKSGDHARDNRMHKDIIQSGKYPDITFAPDTIDAPVKLDGDSSVQVHGMFALHGGTHAITVPAKVHIANGEVTLASTFEVPYIEWGIKDPSTLFLRVSKTVKIDLQATGKLTGAE